jgi:hypothetical protein
MRIEDENRIGDGQRRIDSWRIQEERIHKRRLESGINSRQTEGDGYQMADGTGKDRMEYERKISSAGTKMKLIEEQWGRPERPMEEKLKGKSGNFKK